MRGSRVLPALAGSVLENVEQFGDFSALVVLITAQDRIFDVMFHMVLENLILDLPDGRGDRADLGQDVDAVALVLDHAGDAANLAFDTVQPGQAGFMGRVLHT